MIGTVNARVDLVERSAGEATDVAAFARDPATTEYHLRRRFSALAGMPLSEYARRRRITLAGTDLATGECDLLALRHIGAIAPQEHARLTGLGDTEPAGILAVAADLNPDAPEGFLRTYRHGVAVGHAPVAEDFARSACKRARGRLCIERRGPGDAAAAVGATATKWLPASPWRLRPEPSILR